MRVPVVYAEGVGQQSPGALRFAAHPGFELKAMSLP